MDELSPEAEAKDMELVATRGKDEQGKRVEFSPPLGGNETERTLRRRGPPWVGYASMTDAGKRTPHQFYSPVKQGFLGGKSWRTPFVRWICPPKPPFGSFRAVPKGTRPGGETPKSIVPAGTRRQWERAPSEVSRPNFT